MVAVERLRGPQSSERPHYGPQPRKHLQPMLPGSSSLGQTLEKRKLGRGGRKQVPLLEVPPGLANLRLTRGKDKFSDNRFCFVFFFPVCMLKVRRFQN